METLYIIVRNDISPGLQAAQACHALREFAQECPEVERHWYAESKNLVLLQVPDEGALEDLGDRLQREGTTVVWWNEPDMDSETTAIAIGPEGEKLLSQLPLALREVEFAETG